MHSHRNVFLLGDYDDAQLDNLPIQTLESTDVCVLNIEIASSSSHCVTQPEYCFNRSHYMDQCFNEQVSKLTQTLLVYDGCMMIVSDFASPNVNNACGFVIANYLQWQSLIMQTLPIVLE